MIVAVIYARGRGSSLTGKNIYLLDGKPLLAHFADEIKKCPYLDEIFVWTESRRVADVAASCGCTPLDRPMEMVHYGSGFYPVSGWHHYVMHQVEQRVGIPAVMLNLNCNYVLLKSTTLTRMIDRLLSAPHLQRIFAVSPVAPGIYMENAETGLAMPLFPDLQGMVRKLGLSADKVDSTETVVEHFSISWEEGRDVQNPEDLPFAEYVLRTRRRRNGT